MKGVYLSSPVEGVMQGLNWNSFLQNKLKLTKKSRIGGSTLTVAVDIKVQ